MALRDEIAPFAQSRNSEPPDRLGLRYDTRQFLPEAGNTVVCHLDRSVLSHESVLKARERMMGLDAAANFLFTPASSLHMTLFEGIIETRRTEDAWPEGIARNAPVHDVTEVLLKRLEDFSPLPPFKVKVAGLRPTGLVLKGATPDDHSRMLDWREALTAPFGYRHRNHDDYRFHMTFAYPTAWVADDHLDNWAEELTKIATELLQEAPVLPLNPPAFCSFADMNHFEELLVLK